MCRLVALMQASAFLICLLLSGCGGEPFAYQPDHELKPGPGLFSGKDGEFTLLGSPKTQEKKVDPEQNKQKQE